MVPSLLEVSGHVTKFWLLINQQKWLSENLLQEKGYVLLPFFLSCCEECHPDDWPSSSYFGSQGQKWQTRTVKPWERSLGAGQLHGSCHFSPGLSTSGYFYMKRNKFSFCLRHCYLGFVLHVVALWVPKKRIFSKTQTSLKNEMIRFVMVTYLCTCLNGGCKTNIRSGKHSRR